MKISIINAYSWANKGDSAIVLAMVSALRQRWPRAEIVVHSLTPELDAGKYARYDLKVVRGLGSHVGAKSHPRRLLRMAWEFAVVAPASIASGALTRISARFALTASVREIAKSDLVISCGGGFLTDTSGWGFISHLSQAGIGLAAKKPVILYSQSIGPFRKSLALRMTRTVLRRSSQVWAREPRTLELAQALGATHCHLAPDAAFGLQREDTPRIQQRIAELRTLAKGRRIVGLTVRDWHFPGEPDGEAGFEAYLNSIGGMILSESDSVFVFVPQVTGPSNDNDLVVARRLAKRVNLPGRVVVLEDDYSPGELKSLMTCFDEFVGTRMHSNIFALMERVPTLAISYLPKTDLIMAMLGLDEYVIPISVATQESLVSGLARLRKSRKEIQDRLDRVLPGMAAAAIDVPNQLRL